MNSDENWQGSLDEGSTYCITCTFTYKHTKKNRGYVTMPRVGFEPAVKVLKWPKTVCSLYRAATVVISSVTFR
jgi:hypothetical protein